MMERIGHLAPDVVCITEGFMDSTAVLGGFEISVKGVSWSREAPGERKVVLWSREPRTAVDLVGNPDVQCGAFVAATTMTPVGAVRVVGVCIPYHFASPAGVIPKSPQWSEHIRFLGGLNNFLAGREGGQATIVLGDFNQFVPRIWGAKAASAALDHALGELSICTAGAIEGVDRPSIDHVALSPELVATSRRGIDEHDDDGKRLSDHFGVAVTLDRSGTEQTG